jgi:hypothetical protein
MYVVFDSNIWLSELGLRSGAAAATKFFLRRAGGVVAIPEVVRLEVRQHLAVRLRDFVKDIQDNHRQLLTAFGTLKELVLPTQEEIQAKVDAAFDGLDVEKIDVPFGIESARSSFLKTIAKAPPSDKTQEFKDGVIWADCLDLLKVADVVLVTSDKAFYKDRTYAQGVAENLKAELAGCPHTLKILPTLADLLETIREPIALNHERLLAACINANPKTVEPALTRTGFTLAGTKSVQYRLFATEDPTKLFFEYTIAVACIDARGEGRTDAEIHLKGDGIYDPTADDFSSMRNFGENLIYVNPDGTPGEVRSAVLFGASIVLGHRQVSSIVRHAIGGNGA